MATVSAPPLRPPAYGLIIAARDASAVDDGFRWDRGITWTPALCSDEIGPSAGGCDTGATSDDDDIAAMEACEAPTFRPVVLYAMRRVSAYGPDNAENEERVRNRLAVTESYQLAKELWAGTIAQSTSPDMENDYFTKSGSATVVDPSPVGVPQAVGVLDAELGECLKGARGMIHVTPNALASLAAASVVRQSGALWLSPLGNVVVADAGYPGTAPSGETGEEWAFATGMVDVRLGPVFVNTDRVAFDRRTNTYELKAERLAAAVYDGCCLLAVQIDPCDSPCAAS